MAPQPRIDEAREAFDLEIRCTETFGSIRPTESQRSTGQYGEIFRV
jgi:hypothetical protein